MAAIESLKSTDYNIFGTRCDKHIQGTPFHMFSSTLYPLIQLCIG